MYEFSAILATIAFFLSLIAYLSIGGSLRRAERAHEKFMKQQVEMIRKEISDALIKIERHTNKMTKINRLLDGSQEAQKKLIDQHKIMNGDMERLRADLETLDASIPDRYRNHRPRDLG